MRKKRDGRKRTEPIKREPGLQVHLDDGYVMPVVIPPSKSETVIRLSKAANGATCVNAPGHVVFLKRDRRA